MTREERIVRDERRTAAHTRATRLASFFDRCWVVYALEFDGGRYIGSTNNARRRWGEHEREVEAGEHHNSALSHLTEWAQLTPTVLAVAPTKEAMQRLEGHFIRTLPCVNDEGAGTRAGDLTQEEIDEAVAEAAKRLADWKNADFSGGRRPSERVARPELQTERVRLPPLRLPSVRVAGGQTKGEQREAAMELARRNASRSLEAWVRYVWPLLNPGTRLVWADWMTDLCQHLEALSRGVFRCMVANYPPGHSKTTICSICWPVWHMGKYGGRDRWLFASWSERNALRDQRQRRELMTSPSFLDVFRPTWTLKIDASAAKYYETTEHGFFRSTTPMSKDVTGAHGDFMVLDDVVPAMAAVGDEALLVQEWWRNTMESRARNRATLRRLYVGQRICQLDLCELWREAGEVDCNFVLPAEFDPDKVWPPTPLGFVDRRKVRGELLFPARFSAEVQAAIKLTTTSAVYAAQHQQAPGKGELSQFPIEGVKRWLRLPVGEAAEWVGAFDTAGGQKVGDQRKGKDGDYSIGQVWARWGDQFYLVEQLRSRKPFVDFCRDALALVLRHPKCLRWFVEARSTGDPVAGVLDEELAKLWRSNQPPTGFTRRPIFERVPHQTHKDARIAESTAHYEHGRVWIPGEVLGEFKAEAQGWRNGGLHDDQIDCAATALARFKRVELSQASVRQVVSSMTRR